MKVVVYLICIFSLLGCSPDVEIGYQPPIAIPLRVSINMRGEVKIGLSGDIVTPIGTFDISGGITVNSIRGNYKNKILLVQVDEKAFVYELEEGKEFKVNFDDSNTLYKKVSLEYESNGDIILELVSVEKMSVEESAFPPNEPSNLTDQSSYATISCADDITQASLRKSPGYTNKDDTKDIIYKVDCGEALQLLGESQQADGITWWKVSWNGYTGWMAERTGTGRTILIFNQ